MRSVTFGPFQFDLDSHELHRSGIAVRLQPQPAKLLALLVERAGALVTRDEIRRSMWGDDTFVDFDQSVNFCVRRIRTALHDNADTPCYVETLPRRGYRFIAPVQRVEVEDDPKVAAPVAVAAPRSRATRGHRIAIAAIVILIAGVAAGSGVLERARLRVSSTVSIAHQKVELGGLF